MENTTSTQAPRLPHESLHAYQVARELLAFVAERRGRFRGLPGEISGHLARASASILLNIAEASGRVSIRDRKMRFGIARGETCEVAAALDAASLFGALGPEEHELARGLLVRLVQMLGKLSA